jgi:hypothetical protein
METAIHAGSIERAQRLAELGLDELLLRQAVEQGLAQWATCTLNHPPSYPGYSAWGETVRALRDLLAPFGWIRSNETNLPFTVNEAQTLAVSVATGDEATGREDETPCTKSSKGPGTADAVAANARQLRLFPIDVRPEDLARLKGDGRRMTWLLLFHRDEQGRQVRCELSRPTSMSENERVDGWAERIILPCISFDNDAGRLPSEGAPGGPVIDVEIRRRG